MNKQEDLNMKNKCYVISRYVFTLKEAEDQINEWNNELKLQPDTKIFEITGKVYEPKLKLVKIK